jgi:hypothetical protein
MDFESETLSPRISRVLFAAIGVAFAWVLLTLVLGFGSSDARAQETDDGGAVADLVTSVVADTTDAVTGAATTVTSTVDAVTTAVVPPPAAHPAPAPQPAAVPVVTPVVKAVGTTVTSATATVRDAAEPGVVAPIATAVSRTISAVPVVGSVAESLGLDEALPAAATGADRALIDITLGLAGTVDRVVPPLAGLEAPAVELVPPGAVPSGTEPAPAAAPSASATGAVLERLIALARALAASAVAVNIFTPPAVLTALAVDGQHPPLGPSVPTSAASLGPLGAGPGVWGALALMALVAHRAWVRRAAPEDDHSPTAPTLGTDVSPD